MTTPTPSRPMNPMELAFQRAVQRRAVQRSKAPPPPQEKRK